MIRLVQGKLRSSGSCGSNRTYGYVNTEALIADHSGKGLAICPLTLTLAEGMKYKKDIPVNLRGAVTGNSIDIVKRKLVFYLDAYAPAGFILQ